MLLLLHGPATFKRSEPSATAHHCATLLPMRCTCHILQFDTRHLQVAITHVTHWTTHGRSLPSIVMIGGHPLQMKVSFAPKSVENLSRAPAETQSALRTQHMNTVTVRFSTWFGSSKEQSPSLTAPVLKGTSRPKVWMPHRT